MEKEKTNYKDTDTSTFLNFLMEIINYVAVIVSAILTFSLSMFMDLLSSTTNLTRTGFCFFLNKKLQKNLKFRYNYGIEKLETFSMLLCDFLLVIGCFCIAGFGIYQFVFPQEVADLILVAVIFKIICVLADGGLLFVNYLSYRKSRTKIAKVSLEGMLASFLFDFSIMLAVLLSMLLKNWSGVGYIEPSFSIVIAIFTIIRAIKRIKNGIGEVVNTTLDEESQMKILKIVNKYNGDFESFNNILSHKIGNKVFIDLDIGFEDKKSYSEIKTLLNKLNKDIETEFPENKVTITINSDKQ